MSATRTQKLQTWIVLGQGKRDQSRSNLESFIFSFLDLSSSLFLFANRVLSAATSLPVAHWSDSELSSSLGPLRPCPLRPCLGFMSSSCPTACCPRVEGMTYCETLGLKRRWRTTCSGWCKQRGWGNRASLSSNWQRTAIFKKLQGE